MTFLITLAVAALILFTIGMTALSFTKMGIVPEDNVSITVDGNGFIKRVLPAGKHVLYPFEKIDFTIATKPKLVSGQVTAVIIKNGIPINVSWSGLYSVKPELITDKTSQRLRSLPNADKAVSRNVDILLRKLAGEYSLEDMFKPAIRERVERQLNQMVVDRLKSAGILLHSFNMQAIKLPNEVSEAMNKAKAIETLDGAIRHIDPTTRDVVRGAYQLEEFLRWESYLPTPSRLAAKRIGAMAD